MGFAFKDVSITALDIHPTVEPQKAQSPDYFQKGFDFLIDQQKYNQIYASQKGIKTDHFELRGLPPREFKTHFWKAYSSISNGVQINPWEIQLPFVCRPTKSRLKLNLTGDGFKIIFRPLIYLSAIGWSTNLYLRLLGEVKNKELIGFMQSLTDKTSQKFPFLIDGQPADLTSVFRHFHNLLLKEVYVAEKPPHPAMKIQRHFVLSLNKFIGSSVEYKKMTPADQGLMRSILFGKEFDAIQEVAEKKSHPLLLTHISAPYNFALTDFDHGTLFFLQRDAMKKDREVAVHCHDHNVKNCIMMTFAILNFHKQSGKADPKTPLGLLCQQVKNILSELPERYSNQFFRNLLSNHQSLSKLIS